MTRRYFHKRGLTLLELIVVVTILFILGTISFFVYQGYAREARNSKRTQDVLTIQKALEQELSIGGSLPDPGKVSSVVHIGSDDETLWVQGFFDESVRQKIKSGISELLDPLTGQSYVYSKVKLAPYYEVLAGYEDDYDITIPNLIDEADAAGGVGGEGGEVQEPPVNNTNAINYIKGNYNSVVLKIAYKGKICFVSVPTFILGEEVAGDVKYDVLNNKLKFPGKSSAQRINGFYPYFDENYHCVSELPKTVNVEGSDFGNIFSDIKWAYQGAGIGNDEKIRKVFNGGYDAITRQAAEFVNGYYKAHIEVVSPAPINGACGELNGKTTGANFDYTKLCSAGQYRDINMDYEGKKRTWVCEGKYSGADSPLCSSDYKMAFIQTVNGSHYEEVTSVTTDIAGNIYVTGKYGGTQASIFGSMENGTGDEGVYASDGFVSKMTSTGGLLWTKTLNGTGTDSLGSVQVDGAGNIYVAGIVEQSANAFGVPIERVVSNEMFVAKLDSNGNMIWLKVAKGASFYDMPSLALDSSNNLFVFGTFLHYEYEGKISDMRLFGSPTPLPFEWNRDTMLAKFSTNGDLIWIKTTGAELAGRIQVAPGGDIVFSGEAWGSVFDASATRSGNGYVMRMNTNGSPVWIQKAGSYLHLAGIDSVGNIYVGGHIGENPVDAFGTILSAESADWGKNDHYAAKLDANGNSQWIRQAGGYNWIWGGLSDKSGNTYMMGSLWNGHSIRYGIDVGPYTTSSPFIVKLDTNGNSIWGKSTGTTSWTMGQNYMNLFHISASGDVYLGGNYSEYPIIFGGGGDTMPRYSGLYDGYFTKIDGNGDVYRY